MSELHTRIAALLDSLARFFELRTAKAVEAIVISNSASRNAYHHGQAEAYADAARECRDAAQEMRTP